MEYYDQSIQALKYILPKIKNVLTIPINISMQEDLFLSDAVKNYFYERNYKYIIFYESALREFKHRMSPLPSHEEALPSIASNCKQINKKENSKNHYKKLLHKIKNTSDAQENDITTEDLYVLYSTFKEEHEFLLLYDFIKKIRPSRPSLTY